ncbi:MAG: Trm112 family protein, partial [Pseudonocardia sp.]
MRLDPTLLQVIACPACHGALEPDDAAGELLCTG